jgi:hypothetical protein
MIPSRCLRITTVLPLEWEDEREIFGELTAYRVVYRGGVEIRMDCGR